MYFTYIIYSKILDKYYVGHTTDLGKRIISHNKGSNKFTAKGVPWELVYKKCFDSKSEAIKFEIYIKKMKSRIYIEKLVG